MRGEITRLFNYHWTQFFCVHFPFVATMWFWLNITYCSNFLAISMQTNVIVFIWRWLKVPLFLVLMASSYRIYIQCSLGLISHKYSYIVLFCPIICGRNWKSCCYAHDIQVCGNRMHILAIVSCSISGVSYHSLIAWCRKVILYAYFLF